MLQLLELSVLAAVVRAVLWRRVWVWVGKLRQIEGHQQLMV
jgi:hypothetical protein